MNTTRTGRFRWTSAQRCQSTTYFHPDRSSLPNRHRLSAALVPSLLLTASVLFNPSHADELVKPAGFPLQAVQACSSEMNHSGAQGVNCVIDTGLNRMLKQGVQMAEEQGKAQLGEAFQIHSRLNVTSKDGRTDVSGDLDVIAPLSFTNVGGPMNVPASFFTQQGVTRFTDSSGAMRNDFRHGVAYRFRLNRQADADVFGISSFYQQSAEYQHRVMVLGMDYAGRFGSGAIRYFNPMSGWQQHLHTGMEQRPLQGMELSGKFGITTAIDLSATRYRWEADDGSGRWEDGTRFALTWKPHTYLRVKAGYDHATHRRADTEMRMEVEIPFGEPRGTPRPYWRGFGERLAFNSAPDSALWRPVEGIGQIALATRAPGTLVADGQPVGIRFLAPQVDSGDAVRVEVFVQNPASEDINVIVHLEPGDGVNPAVAGEDYVDEPVYVTITKGTLSTVVSIPLLMNESMTQARTLSVSVAPAA